MNVKRAVRKKPCILRFVPQLLLITIFAIGQPVFPQTRIVPDSGWVKIYYEEIDGLTKRMGFTPLRSIAIKPGDLEVRIWSGFGMGSGIAGQIIMRVSDKWSAVSMTIPSGGHLINGQPVEPKLEIAPDTIDWPVVWEKLEHAGINEIRDDSEIQSCSRTLDGISYVVEIARSDFYRTYRLGNPQLDRSEDGDRLLNILSILGKAAGGESINIGTVSLPSGEIKTVSFVSNEVPTQPSSPLPTEWTYAKDAFSNGLQESPLGTDQILAQALILNTPSCADPIYPTCCFASGDVGIDLLISPDGSVYAARALSGPPNLKKRSLDAALKWKFLPTANQSQLRRAALSIRYVRQWMRFPWLK